MFTMSTAKNQHEHLSATAESKIRFKGFPCLLLLFSFFAQRMMLLMTPVHKSIQSLRIGGTL